jgi:hypothetical protein
MDPTGGGSAWSSASDSAFHNAENEDSSQKLPKLTANVWRAGRCQLIASATTIVPNEKSVRLFRLPFPETAKRKCSGDRLESVERHKLVCARARAAVRTQMSKGRQRRRAARQIWVVSGSPSFIAVMQSTDLGHRHHCPHFRRLNGSWLRRVLAQGEMSS